MNANDVSRILLGTGSYDNVKSGNAVSVTGDGGAAWNYFGPSYKKLAPRLVTFTPYSEKYKYLLELRKDPTQRERYLQFRKQIEEEYIQSYYELRLKELDVWDLLKRFEEKFGSDIILLCHEPVCEFCHRRLIADYIELKTGVYIDEVAVDTNGNIETLSPIRYTKQLQKLL